MINISNEIYLKKRKLLILLLISLIAISTISLVSAANITISPTTPGGLLTAIDTATKGDTIYLENGVYTGDDNLEINIDKDITVRGKGKNVVIDGENKYTYLFQMVKNDSATKKLLPVSVNLINLKVVNFKDDIIDNWGTLKISNCTFSDNKINGAIIANYENSNCKITNSIFTKNNFIFKNNDAGGSIIYNDNVASFSVSKSIFTNFKSPNYYTGISIENYGNSNSLVSKCKFTNTGKGITICNIDKKSNVRLIDSIFTNDGPSIENIEGSIVISKSTFKNSKSTSITNYGTMKITGSNFTNSQSLSITNDGGTMKISASTFANNKNIKGTGAINNHGSMTINNSKFKNNKGKTAGAITNIGSMTIGGSTFTGNTAKKYGGAIQNGILYNPGILKVTNTKFKNNIAGKSYKAIFNKKEDLFGKSKVITNKVKITPKDGVKFKK